MEGSQVEHFPAGFGRVGIRGAGFSHGFRPDQMKSQAGGQWVAAVPRSLLTIIAICEILGGIGVILPAVTGILPWLTPLAAFVAYGRYVAVPL